MEASILSVRASNDIGRDEVVLRIVDQLPSWSDYDEPLALVEEAFGDHVDPRESGGWSQGMAWHQLAEALGYEESEVRFSYGDDDEV